MRYCGSDRDVGGREGGGSSSNVKKALDGRFRTRGKVGGEAERRRAWLWE